MNKENPTSNAFNLRPKDTPDRPKYIESIDELNTQIEKIEKQISDLSADASLSEADKNGYLTLYQGKIKRLEKDIGYLQVIVDKIDGK